MSGRTFGGILVSALVVLLLLVRPKPQVLLVADSTSDPLLRVNAGSGVTFVRFALHDYAERQVLAYDQSVIAVIILMRSGTVDNTLRWYLQNGAPVLSIWSVRDRRVLCVCGEAFGHDSITRANVAAAIVVQALNSTPREPHATLETRLLYALRTQSFVLDGRSVRLDQSGSGSE